MTGCMTQTGDGRGGGRRVPPHRSPAAPAPRAGASTIDGARRADGRSLALEGRRRLSGLGGRRGATALVLLAATLGLGVTAGLPGCEALPGSQIIIDAQCPFGRGRIQWDVGEPLPELPLGYELCEVEVIRGHQVCVFCDPSNPSAPIYFQTDCTGPYSIARPRGRSGENPPSPLDALGKLDWDCDRLELQREQVTFDPVAERARIRFASPVDLTIPDLAAYPALDVAFDDQAIAVAGPWTLPAGATLAIEGPWLEVAAGARAIGLSTIEFRTDDGSAWRVELHARLPYAALLRGEEVILVTLIG